MRWPRDSGSAWSLLSPAIYTVDPTRSPLPPSLPQATQCVRPWETPGAEPGSRGERRVHPTHQQDPQQHFCASAPGQSVPKLEDLVTPVTRNRMHHFYLFFK